MTVCSCGARPADRVIAVGTGGAARTGAPEAKVAAMPFLASTDAWRSGSAKRRV